MEVEKSLLKDIRDRLKKFKIPKNKNKIFQELCFCILVANTNLENTLKIWNKLKKCFLNCSKKDLSKKLKNLGYRFYNKRAEYIVYNRKFLEIIPEKLKTLNEDELRKWLVKNIKGFGYKEASHFLRNMGYKNFAILDRHILNFLAKNKIISRIPKTLTKKNYLQIENILKRIAERRNMNLAELDLLIFYLETEKLPIK
jgi:N-glycosylase/DNA lyase